MRRNDIKDTELRASTISLGTALLGTTVTEKEAFRLLDAYVDLGGNFIDTALNYADWLGQGKAVSEQTIGKWLKTGQKRETIIIGTKGACPTPDRFFRLSREEVVSDLHNSLSHLQTDCIDLYWLHRDDRTKPVEGIIDMLNEQVQAGKIRYFGCSNWTLSRVLEAQKYAEDTGQQGFCANQMMWSLATPNLAFMEDKTIVYMDQQLERYHAQTGLAAIPFSSQAGGFFSGRYSRDMQVPAGKENFVKMYCNEDNFTKLERVTEVARQLQQSPITIALAYLLSKSFPVFPIIGSYTISQLSESSKANDLRLDASTLRYIDGQTDVYE